MGRLQKKKPVRKKKDKKENVDVTTSSQPKGDLAVKKAALVVDSSRAVKRKQALPQKKPARSWTKQDDNYLNKGLQFLREVKIELKKVTWPTRKQTLGSTLVVIVLVMIIALFLGLVDIGLSGLVRVFIQ